MNYEIIHLIYCKSKFITNDLELLQKNTQMQTPSQWSNLFKLAGKYSSMKPRMTQFCNKRKVQVVKCSTLIFMELSNNGSNALYICTFICTNTEASPFTEKKNPGKSLYAGIARTFISFHCCSFTQ